MATFDWPGDLYPSAMEWGNRKQLVTFQSPYTGSSQVVELPAERWTVSLSFPPMPWAKAAKMEAFLERLVGGANRVRLYHMVRPVPRGSMRDTPTVASTAARGALSITLQSLAGKTLLAGDLFSAGGQLLKAADDALADGSGVMAVSLVHRVRATIASGSSVIWDRPTAEFTAPSGGFTLGYQPRLSEQVSQFDLEEAW